MKEFFELRKLSFGRLFSDSLRGGPGRLLAIVGIGLSMVGIIMVVSMLSSEDPIESHVAKMPDVNPLPGGPRGDAAQDALLVRHSREQAEKAATKGESYTPPLPASVPLKVVEPGVDESQAPATVVTAPTAQVVPVDPPPPTYIPPEKEDAQIIEVASNASPEDPEFKRAVAQFFSEMQATPPRTEYVGNEPTPLATSVSNKDEAGTIRKGPGESNSGQRGGTLLVPAGRGIYAHTIVAVDSDTNGPIILEADSGPLRGDRMIGIFSKNERDRLIVRVNTVEHQGQSLEVRGLVIAPDSMETAVATSVDEHYLERWALPFAAAFVQGLGQAVAMSNSTIQTTPYGGVVQSYGHLNFKQEAEIAAGQGSQQIGQTLTQEMPHGPTVKLAANAMVGVMFLSDVRMESQLVIK